MASEIKIDLDIALGLKNLDKFNSALDQTNKQTNELTSSLKGTSKAFDSIDTSTKDITVGVFAGQVAFNAFNKAVNASVNFLFDSVDASIEAENSLNSLRGALVATGEATQENIDLFSEYAQQIQNTTKFEDDLVLSQIALAKNFGLTNDEAQKLVRASTEVATVLNIDLNSATEKLLASLNGNAKGLKLLGSEFSNLTEEQLKSGKAIDLIIEKFGGQATNATKTYGGQIAQLSNNLNDLQETIGKVVTQNSFVNSSMGIANKVVQALNFGFELLTETTKENSDQLPKLIAQYEEVKKKFGESSNQAFLLEQQILKLSTASNKKLEVDLGFNSSSQDFKNQFRATQEQIKKETVAIVQDTNKEIIKEREHLAKLLRNAGLTELEAIKKERDERIKIAGDDSALLLQIEKDYQQKLAKIKKEESDKSKKDAQESARFQIDLIKKVNDTIKESITNPLQALFGNTQGIADLKKLLSENPQDKRIQDALSEAQKQSASGATIGLTGNILQGAGGAKSILTSGAVLGATALGLPPQLAQSLAPIIEQLFGGPEAVRGLVKSFTESIPQFISNLILAVPAFIDELILQTPRLIESIISQLPFVVQSLAQQMPIVALHLALAMPMVAVSFSTALISNIPAIIKGFVDGLADGLKEILSKINPFGGGGGGGGGGGVGGILKKLKFAEGGQAYVVPSGYPSDSFPAQLTSGELVVDRSTAFKLRQFLDNPQPQQNDSGNSEAILLKIYDALSKPMNVSSDISLNNRTFANIILELNRTNQRLA